MSEHDAAPLAFASLVNSVGDLSAPSSTKFLEVERWLSDQFAAHPVAAKYISQSKQIGNRLGELARRNAAFALVLTDHVDSAVVKIREALTGSLQSTRAIAI